MDLWSLASGLESGPTVMAMARRAALQALIVGVFGQLLLGCASPARSIPSASRSIHAQPTTGDGAGLQWLSDTARSASVAGAGELNLVAFGSGGPGDDVDGFIFIPGGRCALLYARASSTIGDLDLLIYGDDGTEYGLDEAPDDLPTLVVCPAEDQRIYVAARIAMGKGLVAVGMQEFPATLAEQVAKAVGARNYPSTPVPLTEAWPGLEETLNRHRAALGGKWIDQRRVALPADARVSTRLSVKVPAHACLDVLLLAGDGLSRLTMTAADSSGYLFARADEKQEHPYLLLCASSLEESVDLEVRPRSGRGLAVAALSILRGEKKRIELDARVPSYLLGPRQKPMVALSTLSKAQKERRLALRVGEIASWDITPGGCARLELIAEGRLRGVEARIWNARGALLAQTHATWQAPLFVCSRSQVRLDAEAREHNGTLLVQLRKSNKGDASLYALPLAASRLMTRAHAAGKLQLPSDLGKVERLAIAAAQLVRREITVPVGRCRSVVAAREGNGYGIEVRLFGKTNRLEVASARGATSAAARACATRGAPLMLSLEIRALRGRASALMTFFDEPL